MRTLIAALALAFVAACSSSTTPPPESMPTPSASPVTSPASSAVCQSDADCRVFSNYCGGCACTVLMQGDADPSCAGAEVQCLVDPCQGRRAVCTEGACTVAKTDVK